MKREARSQRRPARRTTAPDRRSGRVGIERRYRTLVDHMLEGFAHCRVLYDDGAPSDLVPLEVNRALETLTGLRDVVGRRVSQIVPGLYDTNPELLAAIQRVEQSGRTERFESYVPVLARWFVVTISAVAPACVGLALDDITERKQTDLALRAQGQQLRTIVDAVNDIVFQFDVDGRTLNVWTADDSKLFRPKSEILGRRMAEVLGPDLARPLEELVRRVLRTGNPESLEYSLPLDDGEHWFFAKVRPIPGTDGVPRSVSAGVADITERKQAEERLKWSEAGYRGLVERAPLGLFLSSPDDRFLSANPALVAMLGYESTEEVLRLNVARDVYVEPSERARLKADAARSQVPTVLETQWKRKDGTRITVRIHARAVRDTGGAVAHFDTMVEDVTEQRNLEEQLRQSQKMEAVGRLAGGVAHDFNNLLTAIIGYGELLLNQCDPDDPKRSDIVEILSAGQRATALIGQLLAFSRRQVVRERVLDLNGVVTALDGMLRRLIGEDIHLAISLSPWETTIRVDPSQIEQVILNLVVNARDAMPAGGRMTIETAIVLLDEGFAREHVGVASGAYVLLAVSDTGVGMQPEVLEHIFEPFFTTKESGRGTGLGLSTVYGIVRQNGGLMSADSLPGRGSGFRVYLPFHASSPESAYPPAPAGDAESGRRHIVGGSETVLVVEDDSRVQAMVSRALAEQGYRC